MKLSIVLSTQQTQFQAASLSGALEANVARIAEMGYQGVELAVRDPKLVDFDALAALVEKFNLKVPAIGTGQAWGEEGLSFTDPEPEVRREAVERIMAHIPLAARFDAIIIIGLIRGIIKPGVGRAQAMEWLIEALQTCCTAAFSHGVRLALEPINRYETSIINRAEEGMELISRVGAANFGLLLDTFHMNIEEPHTEESIRACGSRIFHFHVADSNRWPPGAGHLNFPSIISALFQTGYSGFISGEFLPMPDAATAAEKNIAFWRSLKIPT